MTPTGVKGPPVAINECRLTAETSQYSQLVTTSSGIQIQFTNETAKVAVLINFQIGDGHQSAVIRDVGTFSPGITVIHKYRIGAGETYSPLFDAPNLHCAISSIKFDDGSLWQSDQPPLTTTFSVFPDHLDFNNADVAHNRYFIAQTDATGAVSQSNSCAYVASVSLVSSSAYETVFRVTPRSKGACTITLRDRSNRTQHLEVLVRLP